MKMVKAGIAYCALTSAALGMAPENTHEDKQDILAQAVALNRVPPTTVRRLVSVEAAEADLARHDKTCDAAKRKKLVEALAQARAEEQERKAKEEQGKKSQRRARNSTQRRARNRQGQG